MAFLKGRRKGYCFLADSPLINGQRKLVPRPTMNTMIEGDKCVGTVGFGTMDCTRNYWLFPLAEEVREYLTRVARDGLFTPTCVSLGVMNATSYFQGMVVDILRDLVGRACLIYVSDVEGLITNLHAVLLRFMECRLILAALKLVLFATEVV